MSSRLLQTRLFRSESAHAEHLSLFRSVLVVLCKLSHCVSHAVRTVTLSVPPGKERVKGSSTRPKTFGPKRLLSCASAHLECHDLVYGLFVRTAHFDPQAVSAWSKANKWKRRVEGRLLPPLCGW